MSFYLIDNPPVRRQYTTRRIDAPNLIVVHTSEQPPDVIGNDDGAIKLARYIQRRGTAGCYHTIVDSDDSLPLVPPKLQCFGARFVNDRAIHISHATKSAAWDTLPPNYRTAMLQNSANQVAQWCVTYGIPITRVTDGLADGTSTGICSHGDVDPTRRTDPGTTFPWTEWLEMVAHAAIPDGPHGPLIAPIVGAAAAPFGGGWLVAADGGVFTEGRATYHGSAGAIDLNEPIVGIVPNDIGNGYWLVARDGGIFSYNTTHPTEHPDWYANTTRGPIVAAYLDGEPLREFTDPTNSSTQRGPDIVLVEANARTHRIRV
jgi:hypothetical protein